MPHKTWRATTLTWTLVVNVYVPVYDTLLIAVVVTLTIGALLEVEGMQATGWVVFRGRYLRRFLWVGQRPSPRDHGIQPLTILILLLGLVQAVLLQQVVNKKLNEGPAFRELNTFDPFEMGARPLTLVLVCPGKFQCSLSGDCCYIEDKSWKLFEGGYREVCKVESITRSICKYPLWC